MNLRKYAAPKTVSPPSAGPNRSQQNESEPNQARRLRNGKKPTEPTPNKTSQRKKNPSATTTNRPSPPAPLLPENLTQHPPPVPTTQTVSNVASEWKNLENPFSYSGNTASILDQIKSFS